jgi:hypothetical protein
VEEGLGRLGLGHVGIIDVAEERHSLPLQLQRGEAGRAVTVRGGLCSQGSPQPYSPFPAEMISSK